MFFSFFETTPTPQIAGGRAIGQLRLKKAISLEPIVGYTSNQAVDFSFPVVVDQYGPKRDPAGFFFFWKWSPKINPVGSI